MGVINVKTEFEVMGNYGAIEKKTLYVRHYSSSDTVCFFDEDGKFIFAVEETIKNNILAAITRLSAPYNQKFELEDNIQQMDKDEIDKCKL